MKTFKKICLVLISLGIGVLVGGYLFSKSQPRSLLAINRCENCLTHEDLLGLLASVGIQNFPRLMPFKVFETDKTVVIKHPFSSDPIHYLIVPKKDIKNIGEISEADAPYLTDAFLAARWVIEREKLSKYRLYTNGPGSQDVTYLHFHLVAE
ncbi:MAG TPA: HIT domain-containing protein [Thermodesulfobacteriota bacterium]|nr:HIT domain-containing protein [Thermodesulfobacteriota bacterium]